MARHKRVASRKTPQSQPQIVSNQNNEDTGESNQQPFVVKPTSIEDSEQIQYKERSVEEQEGTSKRAKKVRGMTRMSEIWELPAGSRVSVMVDEGGVPVGDSGCKLSRFIGTMVKMSHMAPINYLDWRLMPKKSKEDMFETIMSKFEFPPKITAETKKWIKDDISAKWRKWKSEIKGMFFDESLSKEQMIEKAKKDARVDPEQLKQLIEYWGSQKAKELTEKNKENKAKQNEPHCTGTKTFARLIEEKSNESNGVKLSRAEVYIMSRTKKDGSIVNANAAQVVDDMRRFMNEPTNSESTQEGSSWRNDIYSQVKGPEKKGRVRCLGSMVTSRDIGSSFHSTKNDEKVRKMEEEIKNLKYQLASVVDILRQMNPNQAIQNLLNTASGTQDEEALDVGSCRNASPHGVLHSSSSTHHMEDGSNGK